MAASKAGRSLEDLIKSVPNLADYFYNDTVTAHSQTSAKKSPVPMEFTNWRDEQRAWRETAILFDQSHHMPELFMKGPDAFRLLNSIAINSFANFEPGRAKQFVACNPEGYVIGDCTVFCLEKDRFELVSGMTVHDWVQFQAEHGGYDVSIERDPPTSLNPGERTQFRYELDGPNANAIFREIVDGEPPEIPFFRTARVTIGGCPVLALRHGMAGHGGVEIAGPYARGSAVKAAILKAGEKHGLRQGGQLAYFTTVTESAWMAYPVPAIYTSDKLRAFREWLPADSWEAYTQLGGSFYSKNIEDYYNTPWELGYGHILKFDHDFIGREALEKMSNEPHRSKVSLVWHPEDVMRVFGSLTKPGTPYKYMNFPLVSYGFPQCDEIRNSEGKLIGFSNFSGYSVNEAKLISLAMLDQEYAEPGTEVVLIWGEPNGGSRKPHVERHVQTEVRATVGPAPYAEAVRKRRRQSIGKAA